MKSRRFRLAVAALALAGLVSLPLPSPAQDMDPTLSGMPPVSDTVVGACMAIICGASLNVLRVEPHPAVIASAVGSCLAAFLDALFTPDGTGG